MWKLLLEALQKSNGFKYVFGIVVAVVGSWYDLKGDIRVIETNVQQDQKKIAEQDRVMRDIARDIKEELRELRRDIHLHNNATQELKSGPRRVQ